MHLRRAVDEDSDLGQMLEKAYVTRKWHQETKRYEQEQQTLRSKDPRNLETVGPGKEEENRNHRPCNTSMEEFLLVA